MTTFLLVHGACHGGWCWDPVAALLQAGGHTVVAPDLPCEDLQAGPGEYADVAEAALVASGAATDELVVVGHSLGALTAAVLAGRRPHQTQRLAFVAGIIPAPHMSLEQLAAVDADRDGPLSDEDLEFDAAGRFRFSHLGAVTKLYDDCTEAVAWAAQQQLRFQRSQWTQSVPFDAWPPPERMLSIACRDDRIVNFDWACRVARERLGIEPVVIGGGHCPMLSRPNELARLLALGL